MKRCWDKNPQARPEFRFILEELKGIQREAMQSQN
jgi:hypothetical protein